MWNQHWERDLSLLQAVKVRGEYSAAVEELALAIVDHTDLSIEIAKIEELGSGGLDEAGEKQLVVWRWQRCGRSLLDGDFDWFSYAMQKAANSAF
jgi:hypothetical protein